VVFSTLKMVKEEKRGAHPARCSVLWIRLQERIDKVLGVIRHILPITLVEDDLGVGALLDQVLQILGPEGGVSAEKGVGDHAEGPHVDGLTVAALEHHFWGGIAEGTGHGGQNFVFRVEHLCNTKVGEDEVRVGVCAAVKEVLRLEIWRMLDRCVYLRARIDVPL
jgi:hypothetical protein